MANAIEVSDSLSNTEEHIERAAKIIGIGARREVFEAIYHHKSKIKTVAEIHIRTHLTRLRVLQEGRHLAQKGIVRQVKKNGDTAYEKIDFFHGHKRQILGLAGNAKKIAAYATKRKPAISIPRAITIPTKGASVQLLTVDDIDSFSKVKRVQIGNSISNVISEDQFKRGIQAVIGERGVFKDWGGEASDLYTTRVRFNRKRIATAFAFKGPGLKRKLVPAKMGKNGDQAIRLFQEDAQIFFVQHWLEIDSSVVKLLRSLAVAKSVSTGQKIYYGVIDGYDSERLRIAYPDKVFRKAPSKKMSSTGKRKL